MTLAETAAGMPLTHFLAWLGLFGLLSLFGLWWGFGRLHRAHLVDNVPTAKARSAHQGYVELDGSAALMPGEPIIAPLSGSLCCWYRYRVEHRVARHWNVVHQGSSDEVFLLRDETGECLVDPEGADVASRHVQIWYGNSDWPAAGGGTSWRSVSPHHWHQRFHRLTGMRLWADAGTGWYRYQEEVILPGDELYVVGRFRTLGQQGHAQARDDIVVDYLRRWKRHPEVMARFDTDGDGTVDAGEWQAAREQARAQAEREVRDLQQRGPLHLIGRPADGRPFLLANLSQFDLARRFRLQGWAGVGVFFGAGATTVFMVGTRWLG